MKLIKNQNDILPFINISEVIFVYKRDFRHETKLRS